MRPRDPDGMRVWRKRSGGWHTAIPSGVIGWPEAFSGTAGGG